MKKALALVLVALMLLTAVPFTASAALPTSLSGEINSDQNYSATQGSQTAAIPVTGDLTINRGVIVTIGAGVTLIVNPGVTLTVNGQVNNYGTIITKVNNDGSTAKIVGKGNIANLGENSGTIQHEIRFPAVKSALIEKYRVYYCSNNSHYADEQFFDNGVKFEEEAVHNNWIDVTGGSTRTVADGSTVYFSVVFSQLLVDPYKFEVSNGSSLLERDAGVYVLNVSNSTCVDYGRYDENALIKLIKIDLPSGDGYRVTGHGTSLEQSEQDMIDSAYVKYGDDFRFKVSIKEGWQESNITVTIGGSDPSNTTRDDISGPDKYGYYTINNVTDVKAADKAYEINVMGVVSDDTQNLLKGIFNFIREIFDTIKEIFGAFKDLFNFG